jgi:hypothetical protein
LRIVQESQRDFGQTVQYSVGPTISGRDHKRPRHIVGAVTIFGPRLGQSRMLQTSAPVGQSQQMIEYRRW